jgi:hypothetical protein
MKNKFYVVFDIVPTYNEHTETTYSLIKLDSFGTQLEALSFIDNKETGYGLTILEVWE